MRKEKKIDEMCKLLAKAWKRVPDWRLTQLLSNYRILSDEGDRIYFYQEDDKTYNKILKMISSLEKDGK